MRHPTTRFQLALAATLALTAGLAPASGQVSGGFVDQSIITGAGTPAGQVGEQFDAFIVAIREDLAADDSALRERARDRVLETLESTDVSVGYRNLLTRELGDTLASMAASDDTHAAANAIILAGNISTRTTLDTVEAALSSSDPSVRYAAVYGIGRSIAAVTRSAPAVGAPRVRETIAALAGIIESDDTSLVADAAVRDLNTAGEMTRENFAALREPAFTALATSAAARVKAAGANANSAASATEHAVWLRAAESCRNAMLDQRGLPGDARPAAALLSSVILRHAAIHADQLGDETPEAALLTQLVAAAESTILLMHPDAQPDPTLSQLAQRGRTRGFIAAVDAMLAAGGPVTTEFGLDANDLAW